MEFKPAPKTLGEEKKKKAFPPPKTQMQKENIINKPPKNHKMKPKKLICNIKRKKMN